LIADIMFDIHAFFISRSRSSSTLGPAT